MDPLEAVFFEWERPEKRRGVPQRVYGRAEVVDEAGERYLRGACAPADGLFGLQHGHRTARARQLDGGGEAIRPGAHDHRLVRAASGQDRKSTRLNSSHANISYAVFC